jgi:hypothetical protein
MAPPACIHPQLAETRVGKECRLFWTIQEMIPWAPIPFSGGLTVGNMVDTFYSLVAKCPKEYLVARQ